LASAQSKKSFKGITSKEFCLGVISFSLSSLLPNANGPFICNEEKCGNCSTEIISKTDFTDAYFADANLVILSGQ